MFARKTLRHAQVHRTFHRALHRMYRQRAPTCTHAGSRMPTIDCTRMPAHVYACPHLCTSLRTCNVACACACTCACRHAHAHRQSRCRDMKVCCVQSAQRSHRHRRRESSKNPHKRKKAALCHKRGAINGISQERSNIPGWHLGAMSRTYVRSCTRRPWITGNEKADSGPQRR